MGKKNYKKVISLLLAVALVIGSFAGYTPVYAEENNEVIKIACVGDSLTEGYTSSGGLKGSTAYPAVLQNMLGDGYQVGNFGKTSYTLMKGTDRSYWNSAEFTNSKNYDADIVIIMLGTNDSKDKYWDVEKFKEDAIALYETYENLESSPRVIFAVSPHSYQIAGNDITDKTVDRMVKVQRELILQEQWETIDMYALTTDREDYYHRDKVHFTDEGYAYIAECMYGMLSEGTAPEQPSITIEDVIKNAEFAKVYEGNDQIFDGTRIDDVSEYADEVHSVTHGSVIFRFKVDSDCAAQGVLLGGKVSGTNPTANLTSGGDCSSLYINNQNYFRFAFKHTVAALNGTHPFTDGDWHCVVLSSLSTGKTLRLTIDGVERWNNTVEVNRGLFGKQSALNELTIGAHYNASKNVVNAFKGAISQVVVTSQELTDQEAIEISKAGYSGGESGTGNISRMFNNSIDPGNNTWVFVGGEAVQGTYDQIGGARNYIGHFEEYVRNQKSAGDDPTRQRYMINTAVRGLELADILQNWEEKVTKFDPRAVAYLVGAEDYEQGLSHIADFKAGLKTFIDLALAEKENNGSYAVIQKPFAVKDSEVNHIIAAYCEAVDEVVAEYASDAKKFANIAVIDHFTQTKDNNDFKNNKLNSDGSLNELGHLELGRQFVLAAMNMEDTYPCRQGVRMGQTPEEQPEKYLDILPKATASDDSLTVEIPATAGSDWKYFLTTGEMTISETVTGNTFVIDELIGGEEYVLKIQSADGSKQLTTVMGEVEAGAAGVQYGQKLNTNQQKLADLMEAEDSLTWLFVGDSITHGLVYTYGYAGTPQMFEKYLKDDLGRVNDVVVNTAVSGAHTVSTLNNIEQRVKKYNPDVVAIMLGTNDAFPDVNDVDPGLPITSDQYKANLKTIIANVREVNPDAVIILRSPTPMTSDDGRKANALVNIEKMKEVAEEDQTLIYVDQYTEVNEALTTYSWLDDNNQIFLGNWLHPGINGQIVMAKQFMKACGLWNEDGYIPNLYYKTPVTKETSSVVPKLVTASNLIGVETAELSSKASMSLGAVTIQASTGTKTYTSEVKAGEEYAVLNGIPKGTYEVSVSAYMTNAAKEVTFASQTVTIDDGQFLEFSVLLSNTDAVDLAEGETLGELAVSNTAPAGNYTYTLCEGEGSTDNQKFVIVGNELKIASKLEAGRSYSIRVKAVNGDVTKEAVFVIHAFDKPVDPADDSRDIPVEAMTATAGSVYTPEDQSADKAIDKKLDTIWHTDWRNDKTSHDHHWIAFELDEMYQVDGLRYLNRQDGASGCFLKVKLQTSADGETWTDIRADVIFENKTTWQLVSFAPVETKYVRVKVEDATTDNSGAKFAAAAEIRLTGEPCGNVAPPEVCEVFTDVPHGAWYETYVQYVYDNGLMAGSNGLFNPVKDVTRAQLVTTLYRLANQPEVTDCKALTDFTDVAEGQYYTDAVCWAYNIGVGTGNNGLFNPAGSLTRQQMAAFLHRFAGVMGYDTAQRADFSDMIGADQVSEYAKEAVSWAVGAGLISGSEVTSADGTVSYDLKPRGNTTRAQLAAILQRFCEGNQ